MKTLPENGGSLGAQVILNSSLDERNSVTILQLAAPIDNQDEPYKLENSLKPVLFTAYFEHEEDKIDESQQLILKKIGLALKNCISVNSDEILELHFVGYSSGSQYKLGSKSNNVQIAEDRAKALRNGLGLDLTTPNFITQIKTWDSDENLLRSRMLNDGAMSARTPVEALNRVSTMRLVSSGKCEPKLVGWKRE